MESFKAADGSTDTDFYNSCTMTKDEETPWWRVELPTRYLVTKVKMTIPGDCRSPSFCPNRPKDFTIRVGPHKDDPKKNEM